MDKEHYLHWNWTKFCGPDKFSLWDSSNFAIGSCFQELTLQIPILSLFAIVSAYHCGKQTEPILRTPREKRILYFRYFISILIVILPFLRCILEINLKTGSIYPIDVTLAVVQTFSWGVHFAFLLTFRCYECSGLRGPVIIRSLTLLYFGVLVLYIPAQYNVLINSELHVSYFYFSVVQLVLIFLYGCSMVPGDDHNAERLRHQNMQNQMTASTYGRFREDFDGEYLGTAMENSGFFSKLFFSWVEPLMTKGLNGKLKSTDDFFDLPLSLTSSQLFQKLSDAIVRTSSIEIEVDQTSRYSEIPHPSLMRALHFCYGKAFYMCGILKFVSDIAQFSCPILLYKLVEFIEKQEKPLHVGIVYATGLTVATAIAALCNQHFLFQMTKVSLKIRGSLITVIYQKTLNLSIITLDEISVGGIVNHISTDVDKISGACASFHSFWSIPFQLGVTLYLLYLNVGVAAFSGVVLSIILIPINTIIAKKIAHYTTGCMEHRDERIGLMSEILRGIRSIKLYVWEKYFISKVNSIRSKELYYLKWRKYLDALCVYFWATTPVSMPLLTFSTYVMLGNTLTPAVVFTSMALLNMLIGPLNSFPWVLNGLTEAWVSLKRIQTLLLRPELDLNAYYSHVNTLKNSDEVVIIKDAHFTWQTNHFRMSSITLSIHKGQLTGICGPVGCGKSSFLMALCGEIEKQFGVVAICSMELENGFSLVTQTPWLQYGTIRENILFGKPYDENQYCIILEACALLEDLECLTAGDQTLVGEGGVTLSGGQKIRVNLARAVYQNKDIYLLDDVLASVDTHVANHIFQYCIQKLLLRRGKTVVLATHLTKYLLSAHNVISMDKGCIVKQGLPSEVLSNYNDLSLGMNESILDVSSEAENQSSEQRLRQVTNLEDLNYEEEIEEGTVAFKVYATYFNAVGRFLRLFIAMFLVTMQLTKNGADWWFAYWLNDQRKRPNNGTKFSVTNFTLSLPSLSEIGAPLEYAVSLSNSIRVQTTNDVSRFLFLYCLIGTINSVVTLGRSFSFAIGGIRAATKIHNQLLRSMMKARVVIFDISSVGRILNRFSSDINTVDDSLPFILNIMLASLFSVLGAFTLIIYSSPSLILFLLPVLPVCHRILSYYRCSSRAVKRLASKSLSPLYSHFNETLVGLASIRAFRASARFKRENEDKLENNQKAMFAAAIVQNFSGLQLQIVGVVVVAGVGVVALVQHQSNVANPAFVGLAVCYALSFSASLTSLISSVTETEREMVSVERVSEYLEIPKEENRLLSTKLPHIWPSSGVVQFNNVHLKYRSHLNLSLKGVSFETLPAEKIGVVGRTGAGKSSLLVALFRLTETCGGTIYVDKINIANVSLAELRSRFYVIPQDPFLFSGSIRQNLDPKKKYRDTEICTALQKCHLTPLVKKLGGLNAKISHDGNNLSNGQKQLFCLARALLQNTKVLIIDEATASVDNQTDRQIQNTIQCCFHRSTVITIAHRIHTVMSCDRVLVMSEGELIEFDSPQALQQDKNSAFYSLASQNDIL